MKRYIFSLLLTVLAALGVNAQDSFYNSLLRIEDNIPVPNQVTGRTIHVPFTDAVNNDWQGRYNIQRLNNGTLVGVWLELPDHSAATAASGMVNIHYSDDDGATWTDNNEDLLGNPVSGWPLQAGASTNFLDFNFIHCPNDDLVLIFQERGSNASWNGTNVTQQQWRSTDNGITWAYEQDFVDAVGITDNAKLQGNYENMTVGNTVYVIFCEIRTNLNDTRIRLFKSTDNCATYTFVGNPVEYDEADPDCTESSVANLGGNRFHFIFRTQNLGNAVAKESLDAGLTYTSLVDFSPNIAYGGVHQPHVQQFDDFYILSGRDSKAIINQPGAQYHGRTAFWTTTTLFGQPSTRRYLDPYYEGPSGNDDNDGDSGYGKYIVKEDGTFLFFGYYGDNFAARIYRYDVSNTSTPSNEQYNNTAFFPQTITDQGFRLQMNRDNVYALTPTLTLPQNIIRAHNTLATTPAVWVVVDAVFDVESNEGCIRFDASGTTERVHSNETALGQDWCNNTFTWAAWVKPDDGQPAATQRIFGFAKTNSTASTVDQMFVQLQTDGNVAFRYVEDTGPTSVTFTTTGGTFPDGTTSWTHLAMTCTQGGNMEVFVNGVSQGTASLAGINMANFTNAVNINIGARNNGGSTIDLKYTGLIREVVGLKDVACTSTQINNLMQN